MLAHTTPAVVAHRAVEPEDTALLQGLFAESRPDLDLLPAPTRDALLEMQFRAQAAQYAAAYPHARREIVVADGVDTGRVIVDDTGDAVHIVDVTVACAHRGRGIGTAVVRAVIAEADATARPVRLSVWCANQGARRLYARLGFTPLAGVDESGYLHLQRDPTEQEGS